MDISYNIDSKQSHQHSRGHSRTEIGAAGGWETSGKAISSIGAHPLYWCRKIGFDSRLADMVHKLDNSGELTMATITYRTGYGKKAKYSVRIEELMQEIKELHELNIKIESVQIQNEAPITVS